MRTIPKPDFSVDEVLLECISNYQSETLVSRMKLGKEEMIEWSNILEKKITTNTVFTIDEHECIPKNISKVEMIKLYNDKFAKQGQPGRSYYNILKESPRHNLCPLCGYRPVDSLDHYLPKEKFPALAIVPINLIPTCFGCNKWKFTSKPNTAEEEFLHPYFDNIEEDLWLYSEIKEELPLAILFKVIPHESWDNIKRQRVQKHFEKFHLGQLYSSYASSEIAEKIYSYKKIFEKSGVSALRNDIYKDMESCQYNQVNSWKTAMFDALYNSQWFCEVALNNSIEDLLK